MDELPQPYRMIVKVIETEIFDPVWLEITRLHPELLLDSEGAPLSLRPNYALKNVCTPSSVMEQTFLATSLVETQGFLVMTTSNGACVLADCTGTVLQSLLLKQNDFSAMNLPATANPTKASPLWIASVSLPVSNDRVLRIVVCSTVEVEEAITPPVEEGGKKAPPKKGAAAEPEPMKKVGKCRLSVVEVRLGAPGRFKNPSLIKMSLAYEFFLSLPTSSNTEIRSTDFSFDAEVLAIATTNGVHLYSLPKVEDRSEIGISMENITEDEEDVEEVKPTILEPCLVLDTDSFFQGKVVKHVILSPLVNVGSSGGNARKSVPGGATNVKPQGTQKFPFYKTGMSVTFEDHPLWFVLGLKSTSTDPSLIVSQPGDKVNAIILSQWNLAANVSSLILDEGKSLVVLGLCDGSLCMWNLTSRTFTSVVGRHEQAPTSLCISRHESAEGNNYYLISGALDGTLCFFTLHIPRNVTSDFFFSSSTMSATSASPCISATFNGFRQDVEGNCSVVNIRSLKNIPLAVAQFSNGLSAVYDLQSAKLLGKFVLYSGIMSKQIDWRIASVNEIFTASMLVEVAPETAMVPDDAKGAVATTLPSLPNRRVPKYHVSTSSDIRVIAGLGSIATSSQYGYHAIYYRDDSPVLASFRLEDIFLNFYPGLSAVCNQGSISDIGRMVHMFKVLLPTERLDAKLALEKMSSNFDSFLGNTSVDPSRQGIASSAPGTGANKVRKDSRTGTGGNKSALSSSSTRRGSESNRMGGKRNSKSGLAADGLSVTPKFSSDAESISKLTWERINEPTCIAAKSAAKSQADRVPRKQRLLNQLQDLASGLV